MTPKFSDFKRPRWELTISCAQRCEQGSELCLECLTRALDDFPSFDVEEILIDKGRHVIDSQGIQYLRELSKIKKAVRGSRKLLEDFKPAIERELLGSPVAFFEKFSTNKLPPGLLSRSFVRLVRGTTLYARFMKDVRFLELNDRDRAVILLQVPCLDFHRELAVQTVDSTEILEQYDTPDGVFHVRVYEGISDSQKMYEITNFTLVGEDPSTKEILSDVERRLVVDFGRRFQKIPEKVARVHEAASNFIRSRYPKLAPVQVERLSKLVALRYLHLEKLFGFFSDPDVEEVFLDSTSQPFYLNHWRHGRCVSRSITSPDEAERWISMLRLESGSRLDQRNPSLKWDISLYDDIFRLSIDIAPLVDTGFCLSLRRLKKKKLDLLQLVKLQTLSTRVAAFLTFCVLRGLNVTVLGETDSGKTTLINALDLFSPAHFRKIYVEDVVESTDTGYWTHQLKLRSSHEGERDSHTKARIIENLLHKTPDLIYLGEILSPEDAHAMFHCLSVGLKGFQTIHAQSVESLVRRWRYHMGIDLACMEDLDVLVLMKKTPKGRRVVQVSEVQVRERHPRVVDFYRYDPQEGDWHEFEFAGTKLFEKLEKYEGLGTDQVLREVEALESSLKDAPSLKWVQEKLATIAGRGGGGRCLAS
ncbi:MAG: hypothetical protein Kow0069_02030 [Promethearchaeota archaeon]